MHDGAPAHFSRTAQEFLNNIIITSIDYMSWRGGFIAWPAFFRFESFGFLFMEIF